MPLLIALIGLVLTLALGVVLGVVGLLRRPFRPPTAQPVVAWALMVRVIALAVGLGIALVIAAWRHPDALPALGLGLAVGAVLGTGSGVSARLQRDARLIRQRPNRVFVVLLATAVLARAALSIVGGLAHLPTAMQGTLPMLGGSLLAYPLLHALVLRARVRRLRDADKPRIVRTR